MVSPSQQFLSSISPFDLSVLAEGGLDLFFAEVCDFCRKRFGADRVSLFVGEDQESFPLTFQIGSGYQIPKTARVHARRGVAGVAIRSRRPVIVDDPEQAPEFQGEDLFRRKELESAMVIPLFDGKGMARGVLNVTRGRGGQVYQEFDLELAAAIGSQIGLALSNAQLVEQYRTAQAELNGMFDVAPFAVVLLGEAGEVERTNSAAESLSWQVGAEPPLIFHNALGRARTTPGQRVDLEDHASGKTYSLLLDPIGQRDLLTIQDISHERELGRIRRLAEIGQMTAAIAHEIRNPLTGIRSAAQLIVSDPDQGPVFASIIEEEVMKLNELCENFLEFARPIALRIQSVDLNELVAEVSERMEYEFLAEGVTLRSVLEKDKPTINADRLRLEQIIRNLLRNALQASEKGSTVTVTVKTDGFEVRDDGCGMDMETVEKQFVPFFTTKAQGTGLGMSNVRKIVDTHGGRIEVDSELGLGTTFRVRFGGGE